MYYLHEYIIKHFFRDDKLIKTVVTYNNMKIGKYQSKPVR